MQPATLILVGPGRRRISTSIVCDHNPWEVLRSDRQALAVVRRREGSGRVLYDWDGDAIFGVALCGRGYVAERGCAEMWSGRVRQFLGIRKRVSACEGVVNNRGEAMIIVRCGWFYRTLQQITTSTLASVTSSNTRGRQYLRRRII
jgi:hypothetical protein